MFDQSSLQILQALVLITAGAMFILDTAFRRSNDAARLWSFSYITGFITTYSYVAFYFDPTAWWANGIGNGLFTASLGLLWAGFRVHNGRPVRGWFVVLASLITAGSTLVYGPSATSWTAAPVLFGSVALFAVLICMECLRTMRPHRLLLYFMAFDFAIVAVFYLARIVVIMTIGPEHPVFVDYFSSGPASVLTILLTIVWTTGISVLRAEDDAMSATNLESADHADGPLDAGTFEKLAVDMLKRGDYLQQGFGLIEVRMDKLAELNTAFGRPFGDEALKRFADVLRATVPAAAAIGTRGSGHFSVLVPAASLEEVDRVLTDIRESLLGESLLGEGDLHLSAALGTAHTDIVGFGLSELREAAVAGQRRD